MRTYTATRVKVSRVHLSIANWVGGGNSPWAGHQFIKVSRPVLQTTQGQEECGKQTSLHKLCEKEPRGNLTQNLPTRFPSISATSRFRPRMCGPLKRFNLTHEQIVPSNLHVLFCGGETDLQTAAAHLTMISMLPSCAVPQGQLDSAD